jgi:excinuclease ABC subunit A
VVEHHLDVIAAADWVIELGPGGGEHGGNLVAAGTPQAVSLIAGSPTGRALRWQVQTTIDNPESTTRPL